MKITPEEKKLLEEFIDGTPAWVGVCKQGAMYAKRGEDCCFLCGIPFMEMNKIAKICKKLLQ